MILSISVVFPIIYKFNITVLFESSMSLKSINKPLSDKFNSFFGKIDSTISIPNFFEIVFLIVNRKDKSDGC